MVFTHTSTNTPSYLYKCFANKALKNDFTVQSRSQMFVFPLSFNVSVTKELVGVIGLYPLGGKNSFSVLLALSSIFYCHAHKSTRSKPLCRVLQSSSHRCVISKYFLHHYNNVNKDIDVD